MELTSRSGAMSLERTSHRPGWVKWLSSMKNVNKVPKSELATQIRTALASLLNSLERPEDDLQLAVREHRRLVRCAIERGATMTDVLKHFAAQGVDCSMERLRSVLVAEGLWTKRKGGRKGNPKAGPDNAEQKPVPAT